MALHIKDPKAENAIRLRAQLRKVTLTEAAGAAAAEALKRDRGSLPLKERPAPIWAMVNQTRDTGVKLDKNFYDDLSGENDLRREG